MLFKKRDVQTALDEYQKKHGEDRVPKNLVEVDFNDGFFLSYFSDLPEIKKGDLVTVEGKMENHIGLVTKVLSTFKKPNFDMKWVEKVLDADLSGDYFQWEDDVVSANSKMTAEQFYSMGLERRYRDNPVLHLENMREDFHLSMDQAFTDEVVKLKGKSLYQSNAVAFVALADGRGKAVVLGLSDWYEIDFGYRNGVVTYLSYDCPCFDHCKHEYALTLWLERFTKLFCREHGENFVVCKRTLFLKALQHAKGHITLRFDKAF